MRELTKQNVDTVLASFCVKYGYNHPSVIEAHSNFIICFTAAPNQKFRGETLLWKLLEEEFGAPPMHYDSYTHPLVTGGWTYIHFYIRKLNKENCNVR